MKENKIKTRFVGLLMLLFILFSILFAFSSSAHPASDMELSYNYNNQKLEVLITHNVGDPEDHYIDNVTIRKNGSIFKIYEYTNQTTDSSFTYTYSVNASVGDVIEVYTHCNKGGDLTKQLAVTKSGTSKTESSLTIQDITYYSILGIPFIVHLGIITLFILIATVLLPLLKRWGIIKVHVKWHIRLAYVTIILAFIHGILGLLIYI